ncbi:sulfite exporter TauE/SafE family protein [Yeosuana sp. MJ-SS3]|uniref:Probable membrane transporter protein n=1 Tax=Gilvirhabdus luticola TaxID=3079858 RepID=A0ABU3U3U5_9FLAO|nr:sulfite exporter TauE/SafE family protein [Yeosuana sp. MJ-SS3]MDU8885073.1 sulfite exporter TauE/SafE family protein [Yeosuana sp. MJ-SS3]
MIFETEHIWAFLLILPIVSFLYASVGHGGASGYLALMALFSFAPEFMKPTALLLNLFVAGIAFYHYYKAGYFNKKLFLSFAVTSIPLAFLGGMIELDASIYKKVLGVFLIFAILKMLNVFGKESALIKDVKLWQGLLVGGIIGFFSGLIGIGGGIILTPVILFLHWGKMKEAAAVSALFIWANSAAGLIGQISSGVSISTQSFILVVFAIVGGFFGSYYGSKKFNNKKLRYLLAFVLIIASVKLLFI